MGVLESRSTSAPAAGSLPRLESGRERIRRDHAELRRRLEEIELLLARWEAGGGAYVDGAGYAAGGVYLTGGA